MNGAVFVFSVKCQNLSSFGQFCPFQHMMEFVILKVIPISW